MWLLTREIMCYYGNTLTEEEVNKIIMERVKKQNEQQRCTKFLLSCSAF
jgi:predicted CopG family antitoxin